MDGVFWHNDMGFVVDPQHLPADFADSQPIDEPDFAGVLLSSGKVPALGAAPVASWLLARLFHLTRDRLGFETRGRCLNDGGGYYVNFVAFTRDLKAAAFFDLHADDQGVRLWGTSAADRPGDQVVGSFAGALLEKPDELMVCKLTTIDTDPPDLDKRRFGKPQVYGWDGRTFLGFRKPAAK